MKVSWASQAREGKMVADSTAEKQLSSSVGRMVSMRSSVNKKTTCTLSLGECFFPFLLILMCSLISYLSQAGIISSAKCPPALSVESLP